jgi:hypothetical protein
MEHLAAAALIRYLQSMKGHTMWAKEQLALGGGRIASSNILGGRRARAENLCATWFEDILK